MRGTVKDVKELNKRGYRSLVLQGLRNETIGSTMDSEEKLLT